VISGVCLLAPPIDKPLWRIVVTMVSFKRLTGAEIDRYIRSREWDGKSGALCITGLASAFVRRINGSYSNVVGLPLFETYQMLNGAGYFVE